MYEIMLCAHLIVTYMISTSYYCRITYVWNTWLRNETNAIADFSRRENDNNKGLETKESKLTILPIFHI